MHNAPVSLDWVDNWQPAYKPKCCFWLFYIARRWFAQSLQDLLFSVFICAVVRGECVSCAVGWLLAFAAKRETLQLSRRYSVQQLGIAWELSLRLASGYALRAVTDCALQALREQCSCLNDHSTQGCYGLINSNNFEKHVK